VRQTGIEHYRSTPGNLGASILYRQIDDRTEIVTFSLWESMDSVRGFAGDDPSKEVYYPEDDRFLIERDRRPLRGRLRPRPARERLVARSP
jgi:heme-degrading monooxygenase HmoA